MKTNISRYYGNNLNIIPDNTELDLRVNDEDTAKDEHDEIINNFVNALESLANNCRGIQDLKELTTTISEINRTIVIIKKRYSHNQ